MKRRAFNVPPLRLLALGTLAVALAAVLAIELRGSAVQLPPPPGEAAGRPAEPLPGVAFGAVTKDQTSRYVAAILARPLVSPNRRPGTAVASEGIGLPRLTGVMISSAGKVAIFAGSAGVKSLAVREGERVGAYLIGAIGSDGVTVVGPHGGRLLRPAFDPNPPPNPMAVGPMTVNQTARAPNLPISR